MMTLNDKMAQAEGKRPVFHRLLAQTEMMICHYRDYVPVALSLVLVLVALWGYRGSQAGKLGPPLGDVTGQDLRAVLQAARDIEVGDNPYAHALIFGRSPDFEKFLNWDAAPYPYPPLMAVLARPFLWLQTEIALKLWSGVNLALLFGSALVAVRVFTKAGFVGSAIRFFFILTLFFVYAPTQFDLKLGQLDISILFLLLFTYLLYRAGYDAAGVPLAFVIAIKPILGPMLLFFIWKRRWRMSIIAVVTAALLTALGFCVAGWAWLPDYLEVNRLWASEAFLIFPSNQSLRGFALRALTVNNYIHPLYIIPWLAHVIPALVGLMAAIGWVVSISRSDNREESINGIEYGFTLITLMLLSPLAEDIHFVWVLMPLSALLLATMDDLRGIETVLLLAICLLIALYLGYPALLDKIYAGYETLLHHNELVEQGKVLYTGAYLYGLIALDICLVTYLNLRRISRRRLELLT